MTATVWNSADKGVDAILGSLDTSLSTAGPIACARGTTSRSSGRYYFEVVAFPGASYSLEAGLALSTASLNALPSADVDSWALSESGTLVDNGATTSGWASAITSSDVIGVAVDLDIGDLWFTVNGACPSDSSAPNGTNQAIVGTALGTTFPFCGVSGTSFANIRTQDANLDNLPSGFSAWDAEALTYFESTADAAELVELSGSLLHVEITSSANATDLLGVVNSVVLTSGGAATETVSVRRVMTVEDTVSAADAVGHSSAATLSLESFADASGAAPSPGLTLTESSTANATESTPFKIVVSEQASADASFVSGNTRASVITVVDSANMAESTKMPSTVIVSDVADATESSIGSRRVTVLVDDTAGGVATMSSSGAVMITAADTANASAMLTSAALLHLSFDSSAEVSDYVRLPSGEIKNLWSNTTTTAAAIWSGLPFNSMASINGRLYGAGQDGIFEIEHGIDDNGSPVASHVLWDLDDFGTPQKKRTTSAYINGWSSGVFTVKVINLRGSFSYKTTATGTREATNHRAPLGRGLEAAYYRIGVYQNKDYSVDRVNVEHDSVHRRI